MSKFINGKRYDFVGGYDTKEEAEDAAKQFKLDHKRNDYKIIKTKDQRGDFYALYFT